MSKKKTERVLKNITLKKSLKIEGEQQEFIDSCLKAMEKEHNTGTSRAAECPVKFISSEVQVKIQAIQLDATYINFEYMGDLFYRYKYGAIREIELFVLLGLKIDGKIALGGATPFLSEPEIALCRKKLRESCFWTTLEMHYERDPELILSADALRENGLQSVIVNLYGLIRSAVKNGDHKGAAKIGQTYYVLLERYLMRSSMESTIIANDITE